MDACPRYLCTCIYVIVCMSARKKAPVNLLMCPFELYMFIGVSMQLRVVFKYDFLVLIPYCWSVALEKKIIINKMNRIIQRAQLNNTVYYMTRGSSIGGQYAAILHGNTAFS